jgi:hypothetical protein
MFFLLPDLTFIDTGAVSVDWERELVEGASQQLSQHGRVDGHRINKIGSV